MNRDLFTNSLENAIRQIVLREAEEFERINHGANARRARAPYITRIITIDHRGAEENCGKWYMNGETYGAHVVSMIPFTWTIIRPVSPRIEILLLFFLSLLFLSFSTFFFFFTRFTATRSGPRLRKGCVLSGSPSLAEGTNKISHVSTFAAGKSRQSRNCFFSSSARRIISLACVILVITAVLPSLPICCER